MKLEIRLLAKDDHTLVLTDEKGNLVGDREAMLISPNWSNPTNSLVTIINLKLKTKEYANDK